MRFKLSKYSLFNTLHNVNKGSDLAIVGNVFQTADFLLCETSAAFARSAVEERLNAKDAEDRQGFAKSRSKNLAGISRV